MTGLSLKSYLTAKQPGRNQGVRSCAPALPTISLRALLGGIKRRIVHLSDLHIGLNDSPIPEAQARSVVNAIIKAYPPQGDSYASPRPIVVITGDIVDYGDPPTHFSAARGILDQLKAGGFTVLVIPGNHDYSDAFSTDSFTRLENELPALGEMLKIAGNYASERMSQGQDNTLVSGMTFTPAAATNFAQQMAPYLHDGAYAESWRDQGAVYDLDFILLDGQDKTAVRPDWDNPRQYLKEKIKAVVLAFDFSWASVINAIPLVPHLDQADLADKIAAAVVALVLDPATIYNLDRKSVV